MGDLGYQSSAQESLVICYNKLDSYIEKLRQALTTPYPRYERIGQKDASGHYQQLSTNLLQIENEFYSTIRPKRSNASGEAPLPALWRRGVEYVEVRCLDLNPYLPVGIDARQVHFLDVFLLYCTLADSPASNDDEYRQVLENQRRVVYRGRDPELTLLFGKGEKTLRAWGHELMAEMTPVAKVLDHAFGGEVHIAALQSLMPRLQAPEQTPAAQLLAEMARTGQTYFETARAHALSHKQHFLSMGRDPLIEAHYREMAERSLADQRVIETTDTLGFDQFLARYFAQYQFPLDP